MKVYIGGSFQSQKRLRPIRDQLFSLGIEVVSSWLDECAMPSDMPKDVFDKQLAIKDLTEVRAADCIIVDTFDPSTTGGRMVEWGYALGHTKLRYVVGADNCIFFKLADYHFRSWGELFDFFKENHMTEAYIATGMEGKEFVHASKEVSKVCA